MLAVDHGHSRGGAGGDWEKAFKDCTSLSEISIPPTVTAIKHRSFCQSTQLASVILGEGLEDIGEEAFQDCTLLLEIIIPASVNVITDSAFKRCSQLTTVILEEDAFAECISLHELLVPPAINVIEDSALRGCSSLMRVVFCDEIEEFVTSESMQDW